MNLVMNGIEERPWLMISTVISFVVKRQAIRAGYNSISAIEETLVGRDKFFCPYIRNCSLLIYVF